MPSGFRFALKAPQRITHFQRLVGAAEALAAFVEAADVLGERLGPLLFLALGGWLAFGRFRRGDADGEGEA